MIAAKSLSASAKLARPSVVRVPAIRAARSVLPLRATSAEAAETSAPAPKPAAPIPMASADAYVEDTDFAISKVSFGSILTPVGSSLLLFGFGAYFQLWGGGDLSSVALVYGFPMALLGFALSYAQLEPVPCKSNKAAVAMRESQMTDIQKQVREDTTRFRYGDEQHLEEALERIWRVGKSGGVQRKFCPVLTGLREEVVDGAYALILRFDSKLEDDKWMEREAKYQSFFGPGVIARVCRVNDSTIDVALISDGTGAGRGGGEKPDALPPLMPGLKARQQQ